MLMRLLLAFRSDASGSTAIEYAMIAGMVAVVAITAITNMGNETLALWTDVAGKIVAAMAQ